MIIRLVEARLRLVGMHSFTHRFFFRCRYNYEECMNDSDICVHNELDFILVCVLCHVTPGFSADLVCFPVATGCHYQYFLSAMFQGHLPHMLNVTVHSVNSATAHSSTWTYLIASFIMLISLLFACNIQSRVVEGLGLCRSGSSPRERFTSWTGFSSPRPEWILQGFFPIFSLQPGISPWWYHFILIYSISFCL